MKRLWQAVLVWLLVGGTSSPALGHSQFSSGSYFGVDDVQDSGGNTAGSSGYRLLSAIGQTGVEALLSSSTGHRFYPGFIHLLPSRTPTPSPTPTRTLTPIWMFTPTQTLTATPSDVPTLEPVTHTPSPTLTFTETLTATATPTPSPTRTHSSTGTPTLTRTPTPTSSMTLTWTATSTPTVSATFTSSPTVTSTPSITATPTGTPTPTLSATFTVSPTVTDSPTISRTATRSPTKTVSPTATETIPNEPAVVFFPQPALIGAPAAFRVTVPFALAPEGTARIDISVFNPAGERIAALTDEGRAGTNQVPFATGALAAGVYYYRITINGRTQPFRKLVLWR